MSEDFSSQGKEKKGTSDIPDADNASESAPEQQNSDKQQPDNSEFEAPDSWALLTGCFDPNPLNDDEIDDEDEKQ